MLILWIYMYSLNAFLQFLVPLINEISHKGNEISPEHYICYSKTRELIKQMCNFNFHFGNKDEWIPKKMLLI